MSRTGLDRDALRGLVTLSVVVAVITLGLTGSLQGLFGSKDTHTVRAVFADGQQLRPGNEVRVQGLVAGEVKKVTLNPGGHDATVTMDVRNDRGSFYGDARAVLRWQNILGGGFYVDLQRGSTTTGRLRGAIPRSRTDRQTEVEDITAAVQGRARHGLQTLPGELADALRDEHTLARLLRTVTQVAPDVQHGVGALRGQALDRDLRGLVGDTARTVRILDLPNDQLSGLVSGAAATVATTAARAAQLRYALHNGAGTEQQANVTLDRLRITLGLANPLLAHVEKPATQVAPTFAVLHPAVVDADHLVRRAVPLLHALRPAVASLAGTAKRGLPLVRELTPTIERLDRTILPYINEVDAGTKKSTAVMIGGTFTGLASGAGGQMDANGHFIRFPATVGSSPVNSLPCQIYINNPDAAQIAACETLKQAIGTYFSYQPLGPTPGTEPASSSARRRTRGHRR